MNVIKWPKTESIINCLASIQIKFCQRHVYFYVSDCKDKTMDLGKLGITGKLNLILIHPVISLLLALKSLLKFHIFSMLITNA